MRHEFTSKTKAEAAHRAKGHCEECGRKLMTGDYHYDHVVPAGLGGESTLDNCQVLCRSCHSVKTAKADVPNIARAKRRHRKHIGIRKRSSFPCSKDSKFKKKITGEVVRRVAAE